MLTNPNKGFTLLEMLVAIGIFAIIMTAASGVFSTILQSQERMLAKQLAVSNTSYALEYMSRAVRMAKKDTEGTCLNTSGCNYSKPDSNTIRFLNHDKECVEFLLDDEQIKRRKSGDEYSNFGSAQPFTSKSLKVEDLRFEIQGRCQSDQQQDQQQPTVTILLSAESGEGISFKTQTTATQRDLDVYR